MPQIFGVAKKSEIFKLWQFFYWKHDKATLNQWFYISDLEHAELLKFSMPTSLIYVSHTCITEYNSMTNINCPYLLSVTRRLWTMWVCLVS